MTSFARYSRTIFQFDDADNVDDVVEAIDRSYYMGGYRSRIGSALIEADKWLFQQTAGIIVIERSF